MIDRVTSYCGLPRHVSLDLESVGVGAYGNEVCALANSFPVRSFDIRCIWWSPVSCVISFRGMLDFNDFCSALPSVMCPTMAISAARTLDLPVFAYNKARTSGQLNMLTKINTAWHSHQPKLSSYPRP